LLHLKKYCKISNDKRDGHQQAEVASMRTPFMRVVDGSIQINRARRTVRIEFDLYYQTTRLAANAIADITGARLTYVSVSPDRALGVAHRYTLDVNGDAIRCSTVQNIITATAANDTRDRAKWVEALRVIDTV
jgi:hypothetical protein